MNCGASCALAGVISSPLEMKKIVNEYCLISIIFIANGFIGIGNLSGGRYAGAMNDAVGLFVITGGLLMPALLWACLFHVKSARIAAGIAFLLVTLLCVLSGQRTGFFAGIIGCIPLIFQVNGKFLIRGLIVFSAVITFCIFAIQLFPQQTDFITKRYFDINRNRNISIRVDTTGRSLLWKRAFDKTMEKPILGHGAAADRISEIKGFHNAYLQEWYNGGIFGPALFFGASVLALFKTFRLSQSKTLDDEAQQISRLLFSWMIVLFLTSFFESKLASPSNIMAFTMVLIGVMTHRLEIYANSVALPQPQNRFYLTR
ncbi:O-antigen ligase family protein [bacterium]|nr:O-antigen ligase family protein [bacterium]